MNHQPNQKDNDMMETHVHTCDEHVQRKCMGNFTKY